MTRTPHHRNMRKGRVIKLALLAILLAVLVSAVVLWIQVSRVPAGYAPVSLSPHQRQERAGEFASQLMDFHRGSQHRQSFMLRISEKSLNEYLASIDEIASNLPGSVVRPGQVTEEMAAAGLADPSLSFGKNSITFMVRSTQRDKVLSLGLGFAFTESGQLKVSLESARVGRVSLPQELSNKLLARAKSRAQKWLSAEGSGKSNDQQSLGPADVGEMLAAVICAIDDKPIDTRARIDRKWVRITGLDIVAGGDLTLHVQPLSHNSRLNVGRLNDAARGQLPAELRNR